VVAGLLIGFLVWAYTLLLPAVLIAGNDGLNLLRDGPFGIEALRPQALLGSGGLDPLTHGVLWSLALNLLFFIGVSVLRSPGLRERLQAARFLEDAGGAAAPPRAVAPGSATVGDLQELVLRFLGPVRAAEVFAEYGARAGRALRDRGEQVDPELAQFVEHVLSGVLGTSSARLVLGTTLRGRNMSPEDVVRLLDETSHAIQFGRELLRAALENLSQGVSIVDANLRLVGWNRRYQELFAYPPGLLVVGRSIEELLRFNATRGWLVSADVEAAVARRLDHMRAGRPYLHERQIAGGTVLQIQGNPMPGGGFVTSYSDITEYKRAQQALLEANETLEVRVLERTQALTRLNAELEAARISAERANEAKTRFLATATHDLVQPTTAARLFLSSLQTADLSGGSAAAVARAEAALAAGENLLSGLLDISRLDAGAERARIEVFPLLQVVGSLADEFAVIAQDRGLGFRTINCNHVIVSDPQLLRRLLQNLLSNAIRYTRRGRVVLGCRRRGGRLRIEVWDSGRGIPEDKRGEIFEEFRRIDEPDDGQERGLGLGLAIVDRIARILGHPLELRSWPGRGSAFSIEVPLGDPAAVTWSGTSAGFVPGDGLHGRCVLCLENEAAVLAAMDALLTSWGCRTVPMRDFDAAIAWVRQSASAPDLLLVDYHLDGARSGIELVQQVRDYCGRRIPGIVATADHTLAAQTAARALGCQVVRKPIKPASLRAVMSRLLP
jgi:signal transduction histidine kinase/CheY-like chemotaxis protein